MHELSGVGYCRIMYMYCRFEMMIIEWSLFHYSFDESNLYSNTLMRVQKMELLNSKMVQFSNVSYVRSVPVYSTIVNMSGIIRSLL